MKRLLCLLALLGAALSMSPALAAAHGVHHGLSVSSLQTSPSADVNVDINDHGRTHWAISPVWMAIGAIALIVLILLIVTSVRGQSPGGTTIVRE